MQKEKFKSYSLSRKNKLNIKNINVEDVDITNPENSNKFISAKLIICSI